MFIKPAVNAARFRENLAAAIAARGQNAAQVAERAGIDPAAMRDLMASGRASDGQVAALADYLDQEPRDLAPLIDLRDPDRRDRLPPDGRDVPETDFWLRRIAEGDVYRATPPGIPPTVTASPVVARMPASRPAAAETTLPEPIASSPARRPRE